MKSINLHKIKVLIFSFICFGIIYPFNYLHAQAVPELIYFKFNSVTSGNVPNDAATGTRVSTNGTLNGTTIGGAGLTGTALQGNGGASGSNSITSNWALNLSGPWTLSLWMKGITNTVSSNYIFGGSGGSSFRAFTGTGLVSGGGNLLVRGTGLNDILINNVFDASGTAVMVHVVYDNTTPATRVYVNGALVLTVAQTSTVSLTGTDFRVGGYATSNGSPSGALVDEFRLYNRALTATEIANTWNIELNSGPPCPPSANIVVNTFNSSSVDFTWAAVTGSVGYEYAVDQSSTGPSGTPVASSVNNAVVGGLTPATQYYIHVRNKCTGNGTSTWLTLPFMTLPPCSAPVGFATSFVSNDSASFVWNPLITGTDYQYIVDQNKTSPATLTGATTTLNNFGTASGLAEGNVYYVHIRARCQGNDSSSWSLDSFYTPILCRQPIVSFRDINTNRAVAYWNPVVSGLKYEYALTTLMTPPAIGTETKNLSVLLSFLDYDKIYYFHIRSICSDRGIITRSGWETSEFKTYALGIENMNATPSAIFAYPNPVDDVLTLEIHNKISSDAAIVILDINGREMMHKKITEQVNTVSMKEYASGIYFVRFTDNTASEVIRVIKR